MRIFRLTTISGGGSYLAKVKYYAGFRSLASNVQSSRSKFNSYAGLFFSIQRAYPEQRKPDWLEVR